MLSRRDKWTLLFTITAAVCTLGATSASAETSAASTPAEGATTPKVASESKRFSIEVNPLAAAIGRYSLQGEYLPAPHHALVFNPHFDSVPVKYTVNGQELDGGKLTGFGTELGYRFYTSDTGPAGFFIGPSFLYSSYTQTAAGGGSSDSFGSYGAAVDLGGQAIVGPGIVIGGGFGLQYTKTTTEINTDNLNLASLIIAHGGIRPRFLFTVGYAF